MKLMVFDVGGTEIKYCVMDESLVREEAGSVPTPMSTQEEFFDLLCSLYEPHRGKVEGIAMCLPGFIDSENGRCLGGGALRYNHGKEVAGPLSERTGVPPTTESARRWRNSGTEPSEAAATRASTLSEPASGAAWSLTERS